MPLPTDLDGEIHAAVRESSSQGALALEQLYRQAVEQRQQKSFSAAIARVLSSTSWSFGTGRT